MSVLPARFSISKVKAGYNIFLFSLVCQSHLLSWVISCFFLWECLSRLSSILLIRGNVYADFKAPLTGFCIRFINKLYEYYMCITITSYLLHSTVFICVFFNCISVFLLYTVLYTPAPGWTVKKEFHCREILAFFVPYENKHLKSWIVFICF